MAFLFRVEPTMTRCRQYLGALLATLAVLAVALVTLSWIARISW
jgi:hypothetical protein